MYLQVQSGWRIDYCAASCNYTNCPTEFEEFYTQRRRWIGSTIANLYLLLKEAKIVRKLNQGISIWFLVYQAALLVSTVLGPSTVMLIISGMSCSPFSVSCSMFLLSCSSFRKHFHCCVMYIVLCFFVSCLTFWKQFDCCVMHIVLCVMFTVLKTIWLLCRIRSNLLSSLLIHFIKTWTVQIGQTCCQLYI